jgi:hypothetical protein
MKKINFLLTAVFFVLLLSSESLAQACGEECDASTYPCPTDFPPTTVPWYSACKTYSLVTCPGESPCSVVICYCYRSTGTAFGYDYHIRRIKYADCHNCSTHLTKQQIWDLAYSTLMNDNPAGFPCPGYGSPQQYAYWREDRGICVRELVGTSTINGITITTYADEPCLTSAQCYTSYSVWCDNYGIKHFTKLSSYYEGDCGTGSETAGCEVINCP